MESSPGKKLLGYTAAGIVIMMVLNMSPGINTALSSIGSTGFSPLTKFAKDILPYFFIGIAIFAASKLLKREGQ